MRKKAVFAGLGDYYSRLLTGYSDLKFTLKNINDLNVHLALNNWETSPSLFNETASKSIIAKKLNEVIETLDVDDWLLFYYTGHASRLFPQSDSINNPITYCVTYTPELRFDNFPGLDEFFTEVDYNEIITKFQSKSPKGHLITILDCCFAFGLVSNFSQQTDFHTIIAASSEDKKAAYSKNSSFFIALSQTWGSSFGLMASEVKVIMKKIRSPNMPQIQIATNFVNQSLNT